MSLRTCTERRGHAAVAALRTGFAFLLLLTASTSSADVLSERRLYECREQVTQAQKSGVLYGLEWKLPNEPTVVAGPGYFPLPIDEKERFVDAVNCYLMGGDAGKCVNFDVLDWKSGKPVGRFLFCLYRMNRPVVGIEGN